MSVESSRVEPSWPRWQAVELLRLFGSIPRPLFTSSGRWVYDGGHCRENVRELLAVFSSPCHSFLQGKRAPAFFVFLVFVLRRLLLDQQVWRFMGLNDRLHSHVLLALRPATCLFHLARLSAGGKISDTAAVFILFCLVLTKLLSARCTTYACTLPGVLRRLLIPQVAQVVLDSLYKAMFNMRLRRKFVYSNDKAS